MIGLSRALRADADAALVARPGSITSGKFSVTVERFGNDMGRLFSGVSRLTRYPQIAGSVTGDRVLLPDATEGGRFVDGYFNGCAVRFYRIVNDAMLLVREDTVATWHARTRSRVLGPDRYLPAGTTVWRWAPGLFHRPSAIVRFAVSTIAADGRVSPVSNVVTYTTPAVPVSQSVSNAATAGLTTGVENPALAVPTNVAATPENGGNSVAITWDAVPGALGYVVWRTQYDFADLLQAVDLVGGAGKAPVQTGDLMIAERRISPTATRESCAPDAVLFADSDNPPPTWWGWAADRPGDTLATMTDPAEGGYLRITLGSNRLIPVWTSGGTAQLGLEVLDPSKTYAVTVRARGAVGGETITLRRHNVTRTITLTTQWADHTVTWQPPPLNTGSGLDQTDITFVSPGTLDIAYLIHHRADIAPGGLLPEDLARLTDFGTPSLIRLHQFCKTNPWTYDLADITVRQGQFTRGLPQQLGLILEAGSNPWLQIEWVWSDAELLGLVEYLCAPYVPGTDTPASKPWAYRRHAQGRVEPWLAAFETIMFEAGNENWQDGSIREFYDLPGVSGQSAGKTNALLFDRMIEVMRSSPYWTAEAETKFKWTLGGWNLRDMEHAYSRDNALWSLHADYLMMADYNGGWDNGPTVETPTDPDSWARIAGNTPLEKRRAVAQRMLGYCANARAGRTKPLLAGIYEAGPGYSFPSGSDTVASQREEDSVMKSVASGTATLDAFLMNASHGLISQNFFTYGSRTRWGSHARWSDGGNPNAPFQWLGLVNRLFIPGTITEAVVVVSAKGAILTTQDAELLGAYRLDGPGGKVGLALCNRSITTALDVAARVPAPGATSLTRWTMTGDYQTHNTTAETADAVALVPEPIPILDSITVTIPPGEAVVYEWSAA